MKGRLAKAGYTGSGLFKKKALRELYRVTEGTPRLINSVCDGALLLGYARQDRVIGVDAIREVAHDLGLLAKEEIESGNRDVGRAGPGRTRPRRRRRWLGLRR